MKAEAQRLADELSNTANELADVRRHQNDAIERLREQNEALMYSLKGQGGGKNQDETAVEQVDQCVEMCVGKVCKDVCVGPRNVLAPSLTFTQLSLSLLSLDLTLYIWAGPAAPLHVCACFTVPPSSRSLIVHLLLLQATCLCLCLILRAVFSA